jgi:uracil-DNA glycosylase
MTSYSINNDDNLLNCNIKKLIKKHKELDFDIDTLLITVDDFLNSDTTYLVKLLITNNIHYSWYELFIKQRSILTDTMKNIDLFRNIDVIYPPKELVFKVFEANIESIKIVLLGQDPYIKKGQAMGLSFSVPNDVVIPPSLNNIFKEINIEFPERKYKFDKGGNLSKWSDSGIFLLNSALTVIENKSNSQQSLWSRFTDKVIEYINLNRQGVVFLLLGSFASSKKYFINNNTNHIIFGVHPSPLSAYNGFFNSGIFKKVEEKLKQEFNWKNY